MTELNLPKDSATVQAIYSHYKKTGDSESPRQYLGASEIGHSCERFLWYKFRHCCKESCEGRMYRLFDTGDCEEVRLVKDLRDIGCTVHDVDENGSQFAVSALGGHFSGHMDGCGLGIPEASKTWHVLEFKTHNSKSFTKLKEDGVKSAKPQHYAQMMVYMGLSKMARALYLAKNKDTDELYSERVRYDDSEFVNIMERANRVINSNAPPDRIATREDWYECSYCPAHSLCWNSPGPALPVPSVSCRQCCHATPMMDGIARWQCEKHKRGLSFADQQTACPDHLVLPGLIGFATPIDFNDGCIIFNGALGQWRHGKGGYSTKELTVLAPDQIANPLIGKTKAIFESTFTKCEDGKLMAKWQDVDSRRSGWRGAMGLLKPEWWRKYNEDIESLTPVAQEEGLDYILVEYTGDRAVVMWTDQKMIGASNVEIWEGIS